LQATVIQGNTWPKAVTVSANVAGTIYFVEGSVSVKSVKDITSAHSMLWAQGAVTAANTPTSMALDVENLVNGYYRVFVITAQGALSSPASNIVTISVHPASQATTTTSTTSTTVAVRVHTLDQSHPTWNTNHGAYNVSFSQSVGHSFTAGRTGLLSRIAVGIIKYGTVTKITASIYVANTAGNATGSALAAATIFEPAVPSINCCALTAFDFPSPVTVTARSKYVIVLTTPDYQQMVMVPSFGITGGQYGWWVAGDTYAGGIGILNPLTSPQQSQDLAFQTYVDI
jgi:hypothetical protein